MGHARGHLAGACDARYTPDTKVLQAAENRRRFLLEKMNLQGGRVRVGVELNTAAPSVSLSHCAISCADTYTWQLLRQGSPLVK
jgi:hypothetical protein